MTLFDDLMARPKERLAKDLAAMAKENSDLRRQLLVAEIEIFWTKASERDDYRTASSTSDHLG